MTEIDPQRFALQHLQDMIDNQANDAGLWFKAETEHEAYLQKELRRLHKAIENFQQS